ncbi:TP53 regulating kinase [Lycorma delicatula]|uniref:TP53 regulating kinase n=1 Tax=Lycorma delicatula TaxID=130591 RepID=UPI003F514781
MDNNTNFTIIKQGAEGRIYKGVYLQKPVIVKERFNKKYRHPELDDTLTKERIKAEARGIVRCKVAGIFTPALYLVDLKRRCIFMEDIENSTTAKDYINKLNEDEENEENKKCIDKLAYEIGASVGKMHVNNIIHGDLTTSNILIKANKIYFIDFGLSHVSTSAEDKAVDLYVLERALLSTHANSDRFFKKILLSYQDNNKKYKEVITRFEEVRTRGRKRTMIG